MAFTHSKLAETTVAAGGASTITFNNIPQHYTDLKVMLSTRDTYAATGLSIFVTFNGNASSVYSYKRLIGSGATTSSSSDSARANNFIGDQPGSTASASTFGNMEVYIPNYTSSAAKSYSADATMENNVTSPVYIFLTAGLTSDTSAIKSIAFICQTAFAEHSAVTLYGIRAEV